MEVSEHQSLDLSDLRFNIWWWLLREEKSSKFVIWDSLANIWKLFFSFFLTSRVMVSFWVPLKLGQQSSSISIWLGRVPGSFCLQPKLVSLAMLDFGDPTQVWWRIAQHPCLADWWIQVSWSIGPTSLAAQGLGGTGCILHHEALLVLFSCFPLHLGSAMSCGSLGCAVGFILAILWSRCF